MTLIKKQDYRQRFSMPIETPYIFHSLQSVLIQDKTNSFVPYFFQNKT